jgi:hypothetical protein
VVADNPDAGGDYVTGGDRVAAVPNGRQMETLYLTELGLEGTRSGLLGAWSDGAGLVTYLGHANLDRAADEGLLTAADTGNLDTPTVFLGFGCYLGVVGHPGIDSLAEALILAEGGAVAVIGSEGPSYHANSEPLALDLHARVASGGRLGDLLLDAARKTGIPVGSYQIVGDPATALGSPLAPRGGEGEVYGNEGLAEWLVWAVPPVLGAIDPTQDHDGDSQSTLDELKAGLDAFDASQAFEITGMSRSGDGFELEVNAAPNRALGAQRGPEWNEAPSTFEVDEDASWFRVTLDP